MKKSKIYRGVKFPPDVIRKAFAEFLLSLPEKDGSNRTRKKVCESYDIKCNNEDDFFSVYKKNVAYAEYFVKLENTASFNIKLYPDATEIAVNVPQGGQVDRVLEIFDSRGEKSC